MRDKKNKSTPENSSPEKIQENSKDNVTFWFVFALLAGLYLLANYGGTSTEQSDTSKNAETYRSFDTSGSWSVDSYDTGYEWAEDNDISDFDDCQNEFDTSRAEDGCNDYVKENYTGFKSFDGYECTEDCGGHEAGYAWAEENDIDNYDDCDGYSDSFVEGCEAYVDDNY